MKLNLMIILFFLTGIVNAQKGFTGCATGNERVDAVNANLEQEVLRLTNIEREKRGLTPLIWEDQLGYSARYHAADMALDNYFEHDSHDRKGNKLVEVCGTFDRIKKFYTKGFACAENISAGRSTAKATVDGWMHSPGHKRNILNPDAKYLGVGYYKKEGSDYTHYCVQCFGY